MKENDKLIDAIISLSQEIKGMRKEFTDEMKGMRKDMNHRFEKMEKEQHKTNVLLAEHSRSIIALAEKFDGLSSDLKQTNKRLENLSADFKGLSSDFNKYTKSNNALLKGHEKRIAHLEDNAFGSSIVAEPKVEYKKKKKK